MPSGCNAAAQAIAAASRPRRGRPRGADDSAAQGVRARLVDRDVDEGCRRGADRRRSSRRGCCRCGRRARPGPSSRGPSTSTRCSVPTIPRDPLRVGARAPPAGGEGARASASGGVSSASSAAGVPGRGLYTNANDAVEADLVDELQRLLEVALGLAGKADDEIRRERDARPRGAQRAGRSTCTRAPCSRASSPRARGRNPIAPAGAGATRACRCCA